jgi:hypothetical protein
VIALVLSLLADPDPLPPPPPLPEPVAIPREPRLEHGRTPGYYVNEREHPRFGARLGLGVAAFLTAPVPVRAGFALDAVAVGRVPASRRRPLFCLFPELGYSLAVGPKQTREHLATLGFGLGGAGDGFGVAIIPRFVAGSLLGQPALGVRSGLLVELVKTGGFGLELSHQAVEIAGAWSQAVFVSLFVGFYLPETR